MQGNAKQMTFRVITCRQGSHRQSRSRVARASCSAPSARVYYTTDDDDEDVGTRLMDGPVVPAWEQKGVTVPGTEGQTHVREEAGEKERETLMQISMRPETPVRTSRVKKADHESW